MREHLTGKRRPLPGHTGLVFRRGPRLLCGMALAVMLFLASSGQALAQRGVTVSFLPDSAASFSIEEVASPAKAGEYQIYVPSFMAFSRMPADFNGAVWLRMVLGPSFEKPVGALRVNFGSGLPGVTKLYIPAPAGGFTVMESAPHTAVFTLPENAPFPDALYARFDGTPGLWFRPVLETAPESALGPAPYLILCGVFGAAMLLLLIQYLRKAEEWRLWAAITAGCGLVAAIMPPMPAAGAAFTPLMATTMLMPGLILVFFAHTARHLFDAPRTMPGYDKFLAFFYLVGGAIALWPLVPGNLWVARYLPLAYVALALLLPVAMVAMTRPLKGGMGFFCATLLPVVGVAASAWELTSPGSPLLGGLGGLCGLALGTLALGLAGPVKAVEDKGTEEDVFASLDTAWPDERTEPAPECGENTALPVAETNDTLPLSPWESTAETAGPEENPAAEEVSPAPVDDEYPELGLTEESSAPDPQLEHTPQLAGHPEALAEPERVTDPAPVIPESFAAEAATPAPAVPDTDKQDEPLPVPDAFLHPLSPEPVAEEPPAAIVPAEEAALPVEPTPITLLNEEGPEDGENEGYPQAQPFVPAPPALPMQEYAPRIFDLHLLIKEAYDAAAALGENKNIGMSWFIAPQTGRLFEGQADLLESALRLLLRDMVEAVDRGNVRLNVRRLPDSKDAGHLVFTVVEWDARETYHARNMAGLAEAWALAEKTGGIFSVEHSPTSGATVIFSSVFTPMDKPRVIESVEPPALAVPEAALFAEPEEPRAAQAPAVQLFADHPDIAAPEDLEVTAVPVPSGLDADGLAGEAEAERDPARIIIADTAASSRARTAAAFKDSPYSVLECTSPPAAYTLYTRHPAALVLMNADMPEVDITAAIRDIHANDEIYGRSPAPVAALAGYEAQANRMMQAGCARAPLKPLDRETLLTLAAELAPLPGAEPAAAPLPAPGVRETPQPVAAPPREEARKPEPSPETVLHKALADIPPLEPQKSEEKPAPEPVLPERSGIFASVLPDDAPTDAPRNAPEPGAKRPDAPGLGLLDMIITDDENDERATEETAKEPAQAAAKQPQPEPRPDRERRAPVVKATAGKSTKVVVKPRVSVTTAKTEPQPVRPAPVEPPVQEPKPEPAQAISQVPAPLVHEGAAERDAVTATVSVPAEAPSAEVTPPAYVSLPGEDDKVLHHMLTLVPGLIYELEDAMRDAAKGREEKSALLVQQAAKRVADKAESFGMAKLERMARCVERAAEADDIEPMECVLADLEAWIPRYKEALNKLHREQQW
ncbi:hypothetical protein LJC26_07355 [Desulfovibrio sp. OttesenSCG-928-O18]|nr:hypothetical protein [Desulfovibrio sp. OttesenSCG-928-O18]